MDPNSSTISMCDMTTVSPAPVVDVQAFVEELLLSFGGFRGKGVTEDQLNIDVSTPTFRTWILHIDTMLEDFDKPL